MKQTPCRIDRVKIEKGVGVHAQGRTGQVRGRPDHLPVNRNQLDGGEMKRIEGGLE